MPTKKKRAAPKKSGDGAPPSEPSGPTFLVTEPDGSVGGLVVAAGRFENPKPTEIGASDPYWIVYSRLSTNHARYLHFDRVWPVRTLPESAWQWDELWATWRFRVVDVEQPLLLSDAATWQAFLDAGVPLKPKRKHQPSLLVWPAIKGHIDVLTLLLDAGVDIHRDDPLTAAAAFGQREAAQVLFDRGCDREAALASMTKYQNERAIEILQALGRRSR